MTWTDVGLNEIRNWLYGGTTSATIPSHIGIGTGTTAPSAADTSLLSEVMPTTSRHSVNKAKSDYGIVYDIEIGTGQANGNTLAEMGLFNANTGGNLFVRKTHPDIVKTSSQKVPTFISIVCKSVV